MKNQFLKMAFMAMCLGASSSVYAMNSEERDFEGSTSSSVYAMDPEAGELAGSHFAGKYVIVRNNICEVNNGCVIVEQDDLGSLVIRNFKLTCGHYFDRMQKLQKDMQGKKADCVAERQRMAYVIQNAIITGEESSDVNKHRRMADLIQNNIEAREAYIDESLRIVDFVLNALPETGIKLTVLAEDESLYEGIVQHHEKDLTVRFCVDKSSESDVDYTGPSPYCNNTGAPAKFRLIIQSPYHNNTETPAEFSLIKEGSRRYLMREWRQFWDHREMVWR